MDADVAYILDVCGHAVLCADCSNRVHECPMCRKPVRREDRKRVFFRLIQ